MPQTNPPPKDHSESRQAILDAATEEFAARGLDGVRVEHVARRAGFNKALVYKHFGNREQLFCAVLDAQLGQRMRVLASAPSTTGDAMAAWSAATFANPLFGKLMMREALEYLGEVPRREMERQAYYRRQVDQVSASQARGTLPDGLDPKFLLLALLSIVTFPALFPQISGLVSGLDPNGDEFQQQWSAFLRGFAANLSETTMGEPPDPADA